MSVIPKIAKSKWRQGLTWASCGLRVSTQDRSGPLQAELLSTARHSTKLGLNPGERLSLSGSGHPLFLEPGSKGLGQECGWGAWGGFSRVCHAWPHLTAESMSQS